MPTGDRLRLTMFDIGPFTPGPLPSYADAVIRSEEEHNAERDMRITRATAQIAAANPGGDTDFMPAALMEAGPLPPPPPPPVRPLPDPVRKYKPTDEDGLLIELLEVRATVRLRLSPLACVRVCCVLRREKRI